ncbi:MAG: hypothetical protein LDL33_02630 [Desulfomonile sp.]|nr:hypothetical protein [Desulfomonile sp.]
MDSIPFVHANRLFTIFFVEDLEFWEVRAILDRLLDRNAFDTHIQEIQSRYEIDLEDDSFTVWVSETDVYIRKG